MEIPFPPPPARVETIPQRPADGAVWVDGEWQLLRGDRWAWRYGRWVIPPPKSIFSPWVTSRGAGTRLYFAPGVWRSYSGAKIPPPRPLAVAGARESTVVDPEDVPFDTAPNIAPGDVKKPSAPCPSSPCSWTEELDDGPAQ